MANDFFLDEIESDDFLFRGKGHPTCEVVPLIDRVAAFQEMEASILSATRTVHMTGWVFVPETPLQNSAVKSAIGGGTWLDLLSFVADREKNPVTVRLILSDFDPFFFTPSHRLCWKAVTQLAETAAKLSRTRATNLQCFPSRHEAVSGLLASPLLAKLFSKKSPPLEEKINESLGAYNKLRFDTAFKLFARTPGHWSSIIANTKTRKFTLSSKPNDIVHVGSHHQQHLIVDSEVGFCGGMDVTHLALNDRRHRLARRHKARGEPDLLWHDVHARVHGPVVFDFERNFFLRWQRERELFNVTLQLELEPNRPVRLPTLVFPPMTKLPRELPKPAGIVRAQAHRTFSINSSSATFETKRRDVLDGYEKAIKRAKTYVYIENQYFRHSGVADLLVARHQSTKNLKVIVVLPVAPEEFDERAKDDPFVLQPIALQNEAIDKLIAEFGPDIGIFSPVARFRSAKKSLTHEAGSPQVYVHTKLLVVDDEFASLGSANVNGRSFLLDTELNIAWVGHSVRALRLDLWSEWLGLPPSEISSWTADTFLTHWNEISRRNARSSPAKRSGFVVHHNHDKFNSIAKKLPLLPGSVESFLSIADLGNRPIPPELNEELDPRDRLTPVPDEAPIA
jgi:phosphatidylserine/phosphatidylglycerophosphate/cardiolipin synthase-like enzyme